MGLALIPHISEGIPKPQITVSGVHKSHYMRVQWPKLGKSIASYQKKRTPSSWPDAVYCSSAPLSSWTKDSACLPTIRIPNNSISHVLHWLSSSKDSSDNWNAETPEATVLALNKEDYLYDTNSAWNLSVSALPLISYINLVRVFNITGICSLVWMMS